MTLYLPKNLAALAALANPDHTRYPNTMGCIRIRDSGGGAYRADVTDGRRLLIVRGTEADMAWEQVNGAPNGAADGFIPAKKLVEVMKFVGKEPPDDLLGVALAEGEATLVTRNGVVSGIYSLDRPEGGFPPTDAVLPTTPAAFGASVPVKLLHSLLGAMLKLDLVNDVADLLWFPNQHLLGFTAKTEHGQFVDALLMTLVKEEPEVKGVK